MLSILATRSGRITAATLCLAVGLPVLFWLGKTLIPEFDDEPTAVRVDLELIEMGTGDLVADATIAVIRRAGGRDMPEITPIITQDGRAMLRLRPGLSTHEAAYLHVEAEGFKTYREKIITLLDGVQIVAGEHEVKVLLEPERK